MRAGTSAMRSHGGRLRLPLVLVVLVLAWGSSAAAQGVTRYAIVIGNNEGAADETTLRYAESDARRVHEVLVDLGGFLPEHSHLLLGGDAESVRRVLIHVNDQIRARDDQSVLLVYYSGHGDATALHLGESRLPLDQLRQLVRGSAASFRVLFLDACRSGGITRARGGRHVSAFPIELAQELAGEGVVFVSSTAADEDAQESDRLRGSFFTHHLVSGLMGAADDDDDGRIDLEEAYRYAYHNTIRASSRTLAGVQHPSYRYDHSGRGSFVITAPGTYSEARATLDFPSGRTYLLFDGDSEGPVVAEVGVHDRRRTLSLRPGTYHVVGRASDHLLEGEVRVDRGERTRLGDERLERVEYARLVRRGGTSEVRRAHQVTVGYRFRTAVIRGASLCHGFSVGYALELEHLSIGARAVGCRGSFDNDYLSATTDELGLELLAAHLWDVPWLSLGVGVVAGASVLFEQFETRGEAPDRASAAGQVGVLASTSLELGRGFTLGALVTAVTYFFSEGEAASATARFALSTTAAVGKHF